MTVKVYNTYHKETEFLDGTIEEARKEKEKMLSIKAWELAENELEEDWELYYKSYKEALQATYNDIFLTLCSEIEYSIVE
ncbi:hypothetical protein [Enterococcus phage 163]|uniref:Uncharacterized protein n=2 Tax=Schiekvirus TaxID=2732968 RepID=A0A7G8ZZB1_9CAUD|nr:hypothetical protein iF6_183 [Enterococcus phage iF6]CAD0300668.1 hypothetical protein [Enterococcus phage 163]